MGFAALAAQDRASCFSYSTSLVQQSYGRNEPPCLFQPGDIIRIRNGGLQTYKVRWAEFVQATGTWLVHATFGPCKLYLYQEDLIGV